MFKKILTSILLGIAMGCTFFTVCGMIFNAVSPQGELLSGKMFIEQAVVSMIIGAVFYVGGLIYENERLPRALQILIHMGTGMTVFFIAAFNIGWFSFTYGVIASIIFIAIAFAISFTIWFCFYLYHKCEARAMNERIKSKNSAS